MSNVYDDPRYPHAEKLARIANEPRQLMDVARECAAIIRRAEADGVVIDDGNVIDLLADNLTRVSLADLRSALAVSGLGARFPRATSVRS